MDKDEGLEIASEGPLSLVECGRTAIIMVADTRPLRTDTEISVNIANGYATGAYISRYGVPRKGEYHVHDEFKYIVEDVMYRTWPSDPSRGTTRGVRVKPEPRDEWAEAWSSDQVRRLLFDLDPAEMPRAGEHVRLGHRDGTGATYYEVACVLWHTVKHPGSLPDTMQYGIVPEVFLREVEGDTWSEKVGEQLRAAGASSWGP